MLVPALVDPVTGYRWYTDDQVAPARLVAGLRRVGMPLAEIGAALRHRSERQWSAGCWTRTCAGWRTAWPTPAVSFSRVRALIDRGSR